MGLTRGDRVRIIAGPGRGKIGRVVFSDMTTDHVTVSLEDITAGYLHLNVDIRNCEKIETLFWNELVNSAGM